MDLGLYIYLFLFTSIFFLYQSQSYFYSKLPQMIDKKLLGNYNSIFFDSFFCVGYVMACFGGSDTLGSVILVLFFFRNYYI